MKHASTGHYLSKLESVFWRKDRTPQSRTLLSAQAGDRATGGCTIEDTSITAGSAAPEIELQTKVHKDFTEKAPTLTHGKLM